ncbi:uncharacterized protein LOC108916321 isoform X3 [Anoplophora glabripennis]|uniref:uncharacterized protein LOC108916321 isoform X3 n=1 Tax=Anoplophora glabripennis TaxID=217634 RepID=UPI000874A8CC|nr:uncharacterized protein LOC108916321 isoform X3 [Anoplophora glabripennis]
MKITVAVLQGLLLVVVPVCSQRHCHQEPDKTYYFVYNSSVELKTYYCSQSDHEDLECTRRKGKLLTDYFPKGIYNNCQNSVFVNVIKFFRWDRLKVNVCELSVRITMRGKTVKFPDNTLCLYRKGTCHNKNISKDVFWIVSDICLDLILVSNGNFSVWNSVQDQTTFISNNITNLTLTEKFELCEFDMWETNYEGVIVSENLTRTQKRAGSPHLKGDLEGFCGYKESEKRIPKAWYVYKYPTNVTVHICLVNVTSSCQEMNLTEINNTDLLNQCKKNVCNISPCSYESKMVVCDTTVQVDLENDLLRGLPQKCKYSEGVCTELNMFWRYTDRCDAIEKAYQAHEKQCGSAKCVIQDNNSTELILLREDELCGRNIWYTDQQGLVASETELQFSVWKTDEDLDLLIYQQSEDITKLRTALFCVTFLVLFCVLWYLFNVVVNFMSLRRLNRNRAYREKVRLMNCVSQGLTSRYLFLEETKTPRGVTSVKASELYASVDNELYNKPQQHLN